jgi:hypothetical protein
MARKKPGVRSYGLSRTGRRRVCSHCRRLDDAEAAPLFGDLGPLEHLCDHDDLDQIPIIEVRPDTGALRPVFLWANPRAPYRIHNCLLRYVTQIDSCLYQARLSTPCLSEHPVQLVKRVASLRDNTVRANRIGCDGIDKSVRHNGATSALTVSWVSLHDIGSLAIKQASLRAATSHANVDFAAPFAARL